MGGVGIGSLNEYRHTWENYEPYYIAENILEAANKIVEDIAVL
jgi:D-glycero-D-manno-heptose 1,7-bisphosphate phosphatase